MREILFVTDNRLSVREMIRGSTDPIYWKNADTLITITQNEEVVFMQIATTESEIRGRRYNTIIPYQCRNKALIITARTRYHLVLEPEETS